MNRCTRTSPSRLLKDKSLGRRPDQPRDDSQMWSEGGSVLEQDVAPEALQVQLLPIESMEARGKLAKTSP